MNFTQEPSVINISSLDGDAERAVTSQFSYLRRKSVRSSTETEDGPGFGHLDKIQDDT